MCRCVSIGVRKKTSTSVRRQSRLLRAPAYWARAPALAHRSMRAPSSNMRAPSSQMGGHNHILNVDVYAYSLVKTVFRSRLAKHAQIQHIVREDCKTINGALWYCGRIIPLSKWRSTKIWACMLNFKQTSLQRDLLPDGNTKLVKQR